jgi:hypothetical protein
VPNELRGDSSRLGEVVNCGDTGKAKPLAEIIDGESLTLPSFKASETAGDGREPYIPPLEE